MTARHDERKKATEVEYAIVGGGVAGLYTAWRLARAGKKDIHVYEAEERSGGRLLSVEMPTMPFRAELGGMRYTNRQLLVNHLVEQLKLETTEFSFGKCKKVLFLRGHHLFEGDQVPYQLDRAEKEKSCADLMKHAMTCALRDVDFDPAKQKLAGFDPPYPDLIQEIDLLQSKLRRLDHAGTMISIDYLTPWQWELLKRLGSLKGSWLFDIGFWNLLQHYLSSEGFLFLHDALGYESIVLNWNAAEAIPWFLRDFPVTYRTMKRGMQLIPTRLQEEFQETYGGHWHPQHKALTVKRIRGGRHPEDTVFHIKFDNQPAVTARHLVLALPSEALKDIKISRRDEYHLDPAEVKALDTLDNLLPESLSSVVGQRLFKLFLGYNHAWWDDPRGIGGPSGTAITDLPIRQVYYWGPDKQVREWDPERPVEPLTTKGMLMASYSDSHYVDFWTPLHREGNRNYFLRPEEGEEVSDEDHRTLTVFGVTKNMVLKAHRQVKRLHPQLSLADAIPEPVVALEKEWPHGWHAWKVHMEPWVVMQGLKRPFTNENLFSENLFICGEAFSEDQGWVEGALQSAELVLDELKIPPPDVPSDHYHALGYTGYMEYIGNWPDLNGLPPRGDIPDPEEDKRSGRRGSAADPDVAPAPIPINKIVGGSGLAPLP